MYGISSELEVKFIVYMTSYRILCLDKIINTSVRSKTYQRMTEKYT
jgi:hypothetical protein